MVPPILAESRKGATNLISYKIQSENYIAMEIVAQFHGTLKHSDG